MCTVDVDPTPSRSRDATSPISQTSVNGWAKLQYNFPVVVLVQAYLWCGGMFVRAYVELSLI